MTRGVSIVLAAVAAVAAAACVAPGGAWAAWSAPALLSETNGEQALAGLGAGSGDPDVSADGRYVVFSTTARNLVSVPDADPEYFRRGGVVRKDLATGSIELVAPGNRYRVVTPATIALRGAASPAVSADGRFVAFQTQDVLAPEDTNGDRRDVYVRDMARPIGDPGAYELVSARDGGTQAATYDSGQGASTGAPGAFLSDDGDTVLFATSPSDLPAGGSSTPAGQQLFIRHRASRRTVPVNVARDPVTGAMTDRTLGGSLTPAAARLSGDGSTVVWLGDAATDQQEVRMLPDEINDLPRPLLWRRVGADRTAPTRRVAAAGDTDDPGCRDGATWTSALGPVAGPCDGPLGRPLVTGIDVSEPAFAVSQDGRRVAFVTQWPVRSQSQAVKELLTGPDVMLVDMTEGLTRKAALREITRSEPSVTSGFSDLTFSADGGTLFIGGSPSGFPLAPPNFVGAPPLDPSVSQIYALDLRSDTIEVVSRGLGEASPLGHTGEWSLAATADGRRLVFSSTATNLVAGDGNESRDVFRIDRRDDVIDVLAQSVPSAPGPIVLSARKRLRVTARTLRDGRIRLTVTVPGSGRVTAVARGTLGAGRSRRSRAISRSVTRRLRKASIIQITLRPTATVRRRIPRRGLAATARVTFTPPRGAPLRRDVVAKFTRPKTSKKQARRNR